MLQAGIRRRSLLVTACVFAVALLLLLAVGTFVHDRQTGITERVSVDSAGNEGNSLSGSPAISADGRFVAFQSSASNLVTGDTNGWSDIFVHDRQTGITERVSVDSAGNQGNAGSWYPAIRADARYVAFESEATNLVPGDNNGWFDIFVHDRQTGITERVSVDSAGNQGNGSSRDPAISADGRYVAFQSCASNLVTGDTNGRADTFVHDRQTGITERVSVDSAGNEGNSFSQEVHVSADGRFVAFASEASNLVPGDNNGWFDILVHDRGAKPVGGIAELPDVSGASGSPAPNYPAVAGLAAAALVALTAGVWYVGRRWLG
jgi:Tol biopolymer transport system component